MCGIVGYAGKGEALPFLLDGLSKLEYRGYDSAGIAVLDGGGIVCKKAKGRLDNLKNLLSEDAPKGSTGIGHTRWATHGEPSEANAHPHIGGGGRIAVAHNGIIENYAYLKSFLMREGFAFKSETDTEVIANLIEYYLKEQESLLDAVLKALACLEGSYALAVLSRDEPGALIGARKESPLIVGINQGQGEYYLASDVPALISRTKDVYFMEDGELCRISQNGAEFFTSSGKAVEKKPHTVDWEAESGEKGGYAHFMLKEIMEQPRAVHDTMRSRLYPGKPVFFEGIEFGEEYLNYLREIYIVACGTAFHAGLVGKSAIERLTGIPVSCEIASEFRYAEPLIGGNTLLITLSQSGETADTLAAVKLAKSKGAKVLAVTNVVGSTLSREADEVIYTWAGPEIAVASTKAYTTQLAALYMLAVHFAEVLDSAPAEELEKIKSELFSLPEAIETILQKEEEIKTLARLISGEGHLFFIGRNLDYAIAQEGSLKLKEISYIHCEAYGAGELKHGTIALIEPGTYVIALCAQEWISGKTASNIKEVKSRGAKVISFGSGENNLCRGESDYYFELPPLDSFVVPVTEIVPLQLFAYYAAVFKGCDVDKPRNLAKSVTVE
ncbi:MAG: glutamine--fructose-6-phosphate transaminase (isomerizing) [Oscillospiraceae bacterium]|jgi:glucosamine--fructose-6-phosphate aminotransferase (isomerizing)|nr:glutamine--fructose-6-phosphate transaminase (isomerizing) [Oscillospiraceae bacterium]